MTQPPGGLQVPGVGCTRHCTLGYKVESLANMLQAFQHTMPTASRILPQQPCHCPTGKLISSQRWESATDMERGGDHNPQMIFNLPVQMGQGQDCCGGILHSGVQGGISG